jgi:hypothetical protein
VHVHMWHQARVDRTSGSGREPKFKLRHYPHIGIQPSSTATGRRRGYGRPPLDDRMRRRWRTLDLIMLAVEVKLL